MTTRRASCSCGQLQLICEGEPVRISVCHCLACQQRTGSAFGAQARYHRDQMSGLQGRASEFVRTADSGNAITFHFCPACGSTVYWEGAATPEIVAVALGCFADPKFPNPKHSVYERRAHRWALMADRADLERMD